MAENSPSDLIRLANSIGEIAGEMKGVNDKLQTMSKNIDEILSNCGKEHDKIITLENKIGDHIDSHKRIIAILTTAYTAVALALTLARDQILNFLVKLRG